jgi:CheY-like chemotaxis protein
MVTNPIDILLIEDNPNDVELTLHAPRKHHLANHIQVINDGEEAVEYIFCKGKYADRDQLLTPKVIFLDLKLPKVDGIEILKMIKSDPQTKKIPVIILTSSKEERDIMTSYESGANSFIVKPVNFENFVASIGDLGLYWLVLNESPKEID